MRVVGYVRVSTGRQEHGPDAQRKAIADEADRRGWQVEWVEDIGRSGRDTDRPGLRRALDLLRRGEAEALVVARLDRLSRSMADFATLLQVAKRQGWSVVALNVNVDTGTPTGRLLAGIMASVAEWEREVIAERTREGLATARAKGVRLGGPVLVPAEVCQRVSAERREGRSLAAIAGGLNDDAVPTAAGGRRWYPSTVRGVLLHATR